MIEETYTVTIANAPRSNNRGGGGMRANPYGAAREKKRYEGLFLQQFMVAGLRKRMEFCSVDITVRFKYKAGGPGRDPENFRQPVVKPLADALVKGGFLGDDTAEWFNVRSFELVVADGDWPWRDPRVRSEVVVRLEASYL